MRYIVRLAPAAERVIRTLEPFDQQGLDRVLAEELMDGPNADKEIRFDSDGGAQVYVDHDHPDGRLYYTATPLSFKAYTAIHRPMTEDERSRACREDADRKAEHGIYVFEILAAESAFTRRPGGLSARPPRPPKRDLPQAGGGTRQNHSQPNPPARTGPDGCDLNAQSRGAANTARGVAAGNRIRRDRSP